MRAGRHASAVFDCMVFLQGAARGSSPAGVCLSLAEAGVIEVFISEQILAEVRDVLTRPVLKRKFSILTDEYVDEFLATIRAISTHRSNVPAVFRYARDPKDEPYLNLALAARVDYLVPRDTDLLDLADSANPDGQRIREFHPELQFVDPVNMLREVPGSSKSPETA
jgi:putative PIN family toxin of toxin-antitoxin system